MKKIVSESSMSINVMDPEEQSAPKVRSDRSELPKSVLSYSLKNLKSFKAKRRSYKFESQKQLFVEELGVVLEQYNPVEHTFDLELLIVCLNIAESYFIKGTKSERKEQKDSAVKQLLLPYFRNDEDLFDLMKESVWRKVVKSNVFKRVYRKIKHFFFPN